MRLATVERVLLLSILALAVAWLVRRMDWPPRDAAEMQQLREQVLTTVLRNGSADELRALLGDLPRSQRRELADSVHVSGPIRKSALFIACLNQSAGLAHALLWAGANVSMGRLDEGTSPMHLAAGWLHSSAVVEVLLAAVDAEDVVRSVSSKPATGGLRAHTPAWWAEYYGHPHTHDRLLAWMRRVAGLEYDSVDDSFVEV